MSTLEIKDLHVSVILDDETTKPILKGVNLTINSGAVSYTHLTLPTIYSV